MQIRIRVVSILVLIFLPHVLYAQEDRPLDRFNVCIKKGVKEARVTGVSLHFFDAETGTLLYQTEGEKSHRITPQESGFKVDQEFLEATRLRIRSTQNWTRYAKRMFREDLLVILLPDKPTQMAVVNEIHLENYLYGLINKECLRSWPLDVKKAQAVAARTYALHKKLRYPNAICDLGSTALDQVYGGFSAEDDAARLAVDITRGEVLVYNRRLVKAFYHSTCGGKTTSSKSVWGEEQPYLKSVNDPYCKASPSYRWTYTLKKAELGAKLGVPKRYRQDFVFDIIRRDESGRVMKARVQYAGKVTLFSGEKLRQKIGYNHLKATGFSFQIRKGVVTFNGKGLGHGVGMCQWGAAEMAKAGIPYTAILKHFYPGTEIKLLY